MYNYLHQSKGFVRRDLLRIGSLSAWGLTMSQLFRAPLANATTIAPKAKSCILLWLDGGPSHLETFDLKPHAPAEVRGPFQSIATNVPGIEVCELLPQTAKVADKLAIVRSLTSPLGEHGLAHHYMLTGYTPSPVLQYPRFGAVTSYMQESRSVIPPYVAIPENRSMGAGFLGSTFDPFITGDPAKPGFKVQDLDFFPDVDAQRLQRRRAYLAEFDAAQAAFEASGARTDSAFDLAYRLVTSSDAKRAFDLKEEPAVTRQRYGARTFGQSCLLARRLVERGVRFVSVVNTGWDTHSGLVLQLRDGFSGAKQGVGLIPTFDLGFAALLSDLSERRLLDETLVIAMGEFGRTPKINTAGGRDHWSRVFSVVLAGGGVRGGQVIGASDRVGESPADNPISPNDLAHSIYTLLGIDPQHELHTADGRPVPVNQGGQFIKQLVA